MNSIFVALLALTTVSDPQFGAFEQRLSDLEKRVQKLETGAFSPVFVADKKCPNGGICGDNCKCAEGKCPGGCPVTAKPGDPRVMVSCRGGWAGGTAVAGAPKGKTWVVTAKHVADIGVHWVCSEGKNYQATLVSSHPSADVSIVEINAEIPTTTVAETDPASGEALSIKAPGATFSHEQVRNGSVSSSSSTTLHLNLQVAPGDSGGGLLDSKGRLAGVLSARQGGHYPAPGIGVSASQVKKLLGELSSGVRLGNIPPAQYQFSPAPYGTCEIPGR